MKTAEQKSTHSQQQSSTAEKPFFEKKQEQSAFSKSLSEPVPFFGSSGNSSIQAKSMNGRSPFFRPTLAPSYVARTAEKPGQREEPLEEPSTVQRIPAFESEVAGDRETAPVQRQASPETASSHPLLQLQRKLGNRAVTQLIQAKLTVGKPNDHYEQEADRVAHTVMRMADPAIQRQGEEKKEEVAQAQPLVGSISPLVQRQTGEKEEPAQTKSLIGTITPLQRQAAEEQKEEPVQAKETATATPQVNASVENNIQSMRGGGKPLEDSTRGFFESRFGHDFGGVRVHTDANASEAATNLNAQAFTVGKDIFFNSGRYEPQTSGGKLLLAHELTHTVQQGASVKRKIKISTGGAPTVQLLPDFIKRGVNWLAERVIPGYTLLNVILGKNLITGEVVERSGVNLIRGYMRLIPVIGQVLLSELEETESLPQAGQWVEGQVAKFGIDFNDIARRVSLMWDEMSVWKGIDGNIEIFKKHLGPVMGKFMAFSSVVMEKVKELRFEAALRLVGATELLDALKQDPTAFKKAADDPKAVLKKFMADALKKGFSNFKDNFITHFKNAALAWLFGKAVEMGVQIPKQFDVIGLFSLVAQLVGATYRQIRTAVVKRLGPKGEMIISKLEATVTFIKDLVTKGPIALWERVKGFLSNLKEMILAKVASLVSMEIITSAVTKLLSMLNPAGALVQLVLTLYRVIKFFIDNWATIKSVAMGILNSIGMVALNKIDSAVGFVENILAKGMKLIIDFLARIFGLSGIADKVKTLIKKISDPVQAAIARVVDWIIEQGKKLFNTLTGNKKKPDDRTDQRKKADLEQGLSEGDELLAGSEPNLDQVRKRLLSIKNKYRLSKLELVIDSESKDEEMVHLEGEINPSAKKPQHKLQIPGSKNNPFKLIWPKPPSQQYPTLYFGGPVGVKRSQAVLKGLFTRQQSDSTGYPVKAYTPHQGGTLPKGPRIGIASAYRIAQGTIVGPLSDATTPGGGKLNRVLARYGFSPDNEGLDADHVCEIQFGGIDALENLWPLDASINSGAGSLMSRAEIEYPNSGKKITIPELKQNVSRRYYFKITGFSS